MSTSLICICIESVKNSKIESFFCRMKIGFLLWHACILLFTSGYASEDVPYDYSATTECLEEPWKVQYGNGGIIYNSEFNSGTKGWTVFGEGTIEERISKNGNKFIVARNRSRPSDSPSQDVTLIEDMYYAFSAWVQVSEGSEIVSVVFRGRNGENVTLHGGTVIAEKGCWSMLKGGVISNFSGLADITFETVNAGVEVWVDSVALWPFTRTQWRSHHQESISKVRKSRVKFHVADENNVAVDGATISLKQIKPAFPIGCEINANILNHTSYRNWFKSRFTVTAFGNEMKWYSNEKTRGLENYTVSDAMLHFCEQNNISVRGHNVVWDDPRYQPDWITNRTTRQDLEDASFKRTKSVVSRYKGKLIAWDVVNENLHFRFYEDKFGDENASAEFYAKTYEIDQKPLLFMNEYNTIEYSTDFASIPSKYARKMKSIVAYYRHNYGNKTLPMAVGLQSRFGSGQPNLVYMRAGMDYLASMGFPLWLTEVFLNKGQDQEYYLEDVLREGYSHPAVEGIVIWPTSPFSKDCQMCLTDETFKNTPNGDIVDKLIKLWNSEALEMTTDSQGLSETSLFHGDYEVVVRHPNTRSSTKSKLKVSKKSAENLCVKSAASAPNLSVSV
ncbi:hypothetical protein RND81_14G046700 [Saponaria officinalis]|uniref:GH10 domain-containing protein n=1 Tax=Saponaria officinalis TaxID=3572 RepID=A0AAW1GNH2_SAPOF